MTYNVWWDIKPYSINQSINHVVVGSRHTTTTTTATTTTAAVASSNMPPLRNSVAAQMTKQSLSSYYGAVAVYSSKLARSRPVSATTYKPSNTG